jgi:hypothetical protein
LEIAVRTNVVINESLLKEAFTVSEVKTKKDLVQNPLYEYFLKRPFDP